MVDEVFFRSRRGHQHKNTNMDRRYVRLDPKKVDFLRLKRGWNLEKLFELAAAEPVALDKRTVKSIINEESVFLNSAKAIAELIGAEDLVAVLHPELLAEIGPPSGWGTPKEFFTTVGEWEAVESLGPVEQTANGLRYDAWKMHHRHLNGRLGRGKCCDLNKLSTQERTRIKAYLTRHAEVCDRIGHRNVVQNRTVSPWEHGAMWWVVDEWIEGATLAELLVGRQPITSPVPTLLRGIAHGLESLHKEEVIRRELTPKHIWISSDDGRPVLTDFELAKLADGAPTVAPTSQWPEDDYRAMEVDSRADLDSRADIYSWGRIASHVICGQLPDKGREADALASVRLPAAVQRVILAAVAIPRSDRPNSISDVLSAIKKW